MKTLRLALFMLWLLVFGFVWGLSFFVPFSSPFAAAEGDAFVTQTIRSTCSDVPCVSPLPEATHRRRASGDEGCLIAEVRLVVDGHEYRKNACIPAHIYLVAQRYGSFEACFSALSRQGVSWRRLCDWAAYPLGRSLAEWLSKFETPPVDAMVALGATGPSVRPHKDGRMVDRSCLLSAVAACLDGGTPAPLALSFAAAEVRTAEVEERTALLSTFSTPYADNANRVHNLRLACRAVNGLALAEGDIFSFNAAVGERSAERGYLPAKVIVDGAYAEGVGGGVCQVSTTLYNAAMLAGLAQVEAHPHSAAVHYVDPARDAMVSGWSDMRFANDTDSPVYLFAEAKGGKVTVRVYGRRLSTPVKLSVQKQVLEPFRNVDEAGHSLDSTEGYRLVSAGQNALRATLTRRQGGTSQILRSNAYPARDAVWQRIPDAAPDDNGRADSQRA